MSMLFQSGALFTGMTVFDNVAFPAAGALRPAGRADPHHRHAMKLQAVGLRGAAS